MKIEQIIKVQEIENSFPKPRNYDDIKADIDKRGIQMPLIISTKNELVCGYTRYQIAQELGINDVPIAQSIMEFANLNEMKQYAILDNDLRRQMSDLERYEYVVKPLLEIEREEAEKRRLSQLKQGESRQTHDASNGEIGKSVDVVGELIGWSGDKIQRIKKVAENAIPEVTEGFPVLR